MAKDNKQRDLISIVIPVYNTGKYLVDCLKSCMDQTYKNIEIIVVDDHSTDQATLDLLKDFEQKDPRFKMIYGAENHGQGYCRNLGVQKCQGKYFTFVDSDDYITPDFIERMYQGIIEFNTDFVICDLAKDLNDPSISNLNNGFKVNTLDSQFNLIHAKDRSVIKTESLVSLNCLDVFPATCCGKLFNIKRYRDEEQIVFATGEDARHREDQDWKANILLNLKTCLVLRFPGYIRVVHLGSVGSPSMKSYSCGIASDFRFYKLLESSEYFNIYSTNLLRSMFNLAKQQCRFTADFNERQQIISFLSKYMQKCDPSLTLNPYLYSSLGSIGWYDLFLNMDSQPVGMMYFSLNPQHDGLSTDCTYVRELFEGLASQGMQITSFNGSCTSCKETAKNIADIKRDFLKAQIEGATLEAAINKSMLFLFKDNGVTYISVRTSSTPPETFTDVDRVVLLRGIQNIAEISFKQSLDFDQQHQDSENADDENLYTNMFRFVEDTQTTYQLRYKYKKRHGDQMQKTQPREAEHFIRPKILLVSGGDLLTQQVCRLFKVAGCKIVYFVNNAAALTFHTTHGQQIPSPVLAATHTSAVAQPQAQTQGQAQAKAQAQAQAMEKLAKMLVNPQAPNSIVSLSQNVIPADLDALFEALNEQSSLNHKMDMAIVALETAKERINQVAFEEAEKLAEAKRAQKAKANKSKGKASNSSKLNHTSAGAANAKANAAKANAASEALDDAMIDQMFGDETDISSRIPSPEEVQKLEELVETRTKRAQEAAEKVETLRAKTLPTPIISPVDPNYLFAPQEFDAVVSFTQELAQCFKEIHGIEAQALGYVLNPEVNQLSKLDAAIKSVPIHILNATQRAANQAKTQGQAQGQSPAQAPERTFITFTHSVLENGLAIFIKLMQVYTQRHPGTKFLLVQEPDDTFVQDLGKLHDENGNNLAKLKLNLSALSVSNSKKFDPISVCAQTKVLLKLGLKADAAVCNLPEALLNHIPVLATNHPRYANLLQDAGKLLDVPASTLRDPSCLPTDEEILPYVEALENLVQNDYTAQCQAALDKLDYRKNVEAWGKLLYQVLGQPFTHDHPGDERVLKVTAN